MNENIKKPWGIIAEFNTPGDLLKTAEKFRDAGYKKFETYTPFPVHGMDKAMGIKETPLPWIVFICGVIGLSIGLGLQTWVHSYAYQLTISGKPYFALPAYIPVAFETTILLSAFGAIFGMLFLNKLPKFWDQTFTHEAFKKVTDDKFFICIDVKDPKYNESNVKEILIDMGGENVTIIED